MKTPWQQYVLHAPSYWLLTQLTIHSLKWKILTAGHGVFKNSYQRLLEILAQFTLLPCTDSFSSWSGKETSRTLSTKTCGYRSVKELRLCRVNLTGLYTALGFSSFLIKNDKGHNSIGLWTFAFSRPLRSCFCRLCKWLRNWHVSLAWNFNSCLWLKRAN